MKSVLLIFSLCPPCFGWPLEKFVIETRKSVFINSVLEKFSSCQLTIITNSHSNIQFFSQNTKAIQIFVLPYEYGDNSYSEIFSTVKFNTTHSVFFGKKYAVKFGTPGCKLNLVLSSVTTSIRLKFFLDTIFLGHTGMHLDMSMERNRHAPSCSVYSIESTFYLLINKKLNLSDTVDTFLKTIQKIQMTRIRFWTIGLMPLDQEFLKHKIRIQIWITSMIGSDKDRVSHPDALLDHFRCQTQQDSFFCQSL